jgi:hypothetical protein
MEQQENNTNPKSFQMYAGKAPLLIQIIAGLMWLGGILLILKGLPWLLLFGIGIIPIALGIFYFRYGSALFKMQKRGYKGAIVIQVILFILGIILWVIDGITQFNSTAVFAIVYSAAVFAILYSYRDKFVN